MKKPLVGTSKVEKSADNAVLGDLVKEYVGLRSQIDALEEQMKPVKEAITQSVLDMGGKLAIEDLMISAVMVERENFRLTEALKVLDRRSLVPFITVSKSPRLTIKRKL